MRRDSEVSPAKVRTDSIIRVGSFVSTFFCHGHSGATHSDWDVMVGMMMALLMGMLRMIVMMRMMMRRRRNIVIMMMMMMVVIMVLIVVVQMMITVTMKLFRR